MQPLVSIIIPIYNREDLIAETLISICNQSYNNWECLVVDDISTDNTQRVIESYIKQDSRIQFYQRPKSKLKGANACRNIGLEKCKGDYVIFFDSDDLMKPNHIKDKFDAILKHQCDFVITKTEYFNYPEGNVFLEKNYNFTSRDITVYNYITQKINWLTYDICIKVDLAKSIIFNEQLQAGQEYNYFSKLILKSTNAVFVNEIVTLRRHHEDSIRGNLKSDRMKNYLSFYKTYWHTYIDTQSNASKAIKKHLVYKCTKLAYKLTRFNIDNTNLLYKALIKELGVKGIYHIIMLHFNMYNQSKV